MPDSIRLLVTSGATSVVERGLGFSSSSTRAARADADLAEGADSDLAAGADSDLAAEADSDLAAGADSDLAAGADADLAAIDDEDADADESDADSDDDDDFLFQNGNFHQGAATTGGGRGATLQSCCS
jgi:hypothetical protein